MNTDSKIFNINNVIHHLKHYLPSQAPLKDFIHHNTLHAFQDRKFYQALEESSAIFGYKTSLSMAEFRGLYIQGKINMAIIDKVIGEAKGKNNVEAWRKKMLSTPYIDNFAGRRCLLRNNWKALYRIDLDLAVHPFLFRFLCSYFDQGISSWKFPVWGKGFLTTIKEMERNTYSSFFKTSRARNLLYGNHCEVDQLLKILVGDETMYEHYIFDQQFAHPGWSGMVAVIEDNPSALLDERRVALEEFIIFELLLEIDTLDDKFGESWSPLGLMLESPPMPLFSPVVGTEYHEVLNLWQDAFEWTYYDQVLAGIAATRHHVKEETGTSFQAFFCIDDRECSLRRYVEEVDPNSETLATPGFFGVEFYYKPMNGNFTMKVCPASLTPKYMIKEISDKPSAKKDFHFSKSTHDMLFGWLITHTIGFWSAFRLFINIFKPRLSPATTLSFKHMDKFSKLTIENNGDGASEDGLQIGFTIDEMTDRLEGVLKSTGLVDNFAPFVYAVGHGASSVNNTHYAGYDCGACSGRPGSVNARVFAYMGNHPQVRANLRARGINIAETTLFVGALHDTTRDEIEFYDDEIKGSAILAKHSINILTFKQSLVLNAKERSRRFATMDKQVDLNKLHEKVKTRSVSLFEPRPELNHATNTLCIVGSRVLTDHIFLDRRAFLNSYDYNIDPDGKYLTGILKAAAPVCGGINLEYYFSRVDNQKLGAGTKLPHNVMGLIGVANGIDGDLRTGLPEQMVEVHDPLRLLLIVEQRRNVVMKVIKSADALYEWFINEWVHLVVIDPEDNGFYRFVEGEFEPYFITSKELSMANDLPHLFEKEIDNLPVLKLK